VGEKHVETHLSLVVPAYNEEARIGDSLKRILMFLKAQSYAWELILVDDGSTDQTLSAAAAAVSNADVDAVLLRNEINSGKGRSVRRGVLAARGANIFFTDADLSTPIEEIERCLPLLATADVVIGSRALPGSNITVHQPAHREAMGRLFNKFVQLAAAPGIKDSQCGFKGFTAKAAREIFKRQRLDGFGFDVELLYIAGKLGYGIVEAPITWHNSAATRVSPLRDGPGMLSDIFRVRMNDLKGLYE